MKVIHTYVCVVDGYRRASRMRNTHGRYTVGAKSEKEAKMLLQDAIGFGSIQVLYRATLDNGAMDPVYASCDPQMGYKEIRQIRFQGENRLEMGPRHANSRL